MLIANIGKLQENTAALCKIGCETLRVRVIRGSGYVYPKKLKLPPLPSGSWIPDVIHPGGKWWQPDGIPTRVEWAMIPVRVEWAGSHTPCILDLLMDSKELSSISDCFRDQLTNKNTKTYTNWLEMITRVLNMLIELKGNNNYSKVFKRVN